MLKKVTECKAVILHNVWRSHIVSKTMMLYYECILIWFKLVVQHFVSACQICYQLSDNENVCCGGSIQVNPCKCRIRWDPQLNRVGPHLLLSAEEQNFNICVCVLMSLTSWLSRTIHCNFNGSLVRGHLWRVGEHCDGQSETLP